MTEKTTAAPPARALLNRLRYRHLHMLQALAAHQNIHRASNHLNMSQPAATRMLQEIEDMFGCQLFERLPRGLRPTALGRQLVRFAESALNGLERCAEDLSLRKQGGYGYLAIGTIMGAAPSLVMNAVARLKLENPQLRIRIMGDTSDQVLRLLEQRQIDVAIARRNAQMQNEAYAFEALGNERLMLVVRSGHPLGRRRKLTLEELVGDWPWILQPASTPARIALDHTLQRMGLPLPSDLTECSSVYSMQQLVQLTDSVMMLSDSALRDYLRMGLVKALPIALDEPMAPFGILTRRHETWSTEQQRFVDWLRSFASSASPQAPP
jgi:DNA-binding transcriptional LysR family regulator